MRSSALVVGLVLLSSVVRAQPLVGPSVGNADLLNAEGVRFYNERDHALARDSFLKAARANPANLSVYLSLARAYAALNQLEQSVFAYRVFVKNSFESVDRTKAQAELEPVERQLSAHGLPPVPLAQRFVALKALVYEAMDKGNFVGDGSASVQLRALLQEGYAAPDLGEMAQKLARAAEQKAEATYQAALAHQKVPAEEMRLAEPLYRLALDCGAQPGRQLARAAFLQGLALFVEGKAFQAQAMFDDAAKKDASDIEAKAYRGLSAFRAGDKAGAIRMLEFDLPTDPRTALLRTASAFDRGPDAAASELERFLFERRFKNVL